MHSLSKKKLIYNRNLLTYYTILFIFDKMEQLVENLYIADMKQLHEGFEKFMVRLTCKI